MLPERFESPNRWFERLQMIQFSVYSFKIYSSPRRHESLFFLCKDWELRYLLSTMVMDSHAGFKSQSGISKGKALLAIHGTLHTNLGGQIGNVDENGL